MISQLWVRPEVAAAAALGNRTLDMTCEPLPGVVEVQHMLAAETECRELGRRGPGICSVVRCRDITATRTRPTTGAKGVGAWHAHHLKTHDAPRQVAAAHGTRRTRVDAGRH